MTNIRYIFRHQGRILGLNAMTDLAMRPGIKSLIKLPVAGLAFVPGLISLSFTGARFSPHTRPYQGMKHYGKEVAAGLKDTALNLIRRLR